jgi:macrolide-specific efflux system membrane fusion protein
MVADEATSLEAVQVAEDNLRVAEARVKSLYAQIRGAQSTLQGNEALLRYTRIYAPISGTVVTLEAREGQTLNATYQTPNLLRIADLSRMTVWTEVSEADVGRLKPEMPVYFTTLGLQDKDGLPRRWNGRLRQVLPAPPVTTTTAATQGSAPAGKVVLYTALFDVENADGALMPQMSAQVFFVLTAAHDVLTVPLSTLEAVPGHPEVFWIRVLENGQVAQRQVKIGARDRLYGEVLEGLKENDVLVTGIRRERASRRVRW